MVGKGTLMVIIGFSMVFGVSSRYWNKTSNRAIENFVDYYDSTAAHNIAVSIANIVVDSVFWNPADTALNLTGSFFHGTYGLRTSVVYIGGTKYILAAAYSDYLGRRGSVRDTVKVLLKQRTFNEYAFFSIDENSTYWITGDTLWGPFHTDDRMYVSGRPVFYGKATTRNGTNPSTLPSGSTNPYFYGGYESGVSVPMPANSVTRAASAATKVFTNTDTYNRDTFDVYLNFNADGTVTFHTARSVTTYNRWGYPTGAMITTTTPDSTVPLSAFGSVILIDNGDAHVKGVLDGSVTIVSRQGAGKSSTGTSGGLPTNNNGNILIEGNVTYKDNPQIKLSNDMLGLVADNNVALATQANPADVTINAAIFAREGKFMYLDYDGDVHGTPMGTLYLYGSIANYTRGPVGTFTGTSTLKTGFLKNYMYDNRFYSSAPPAFPGTDKFAILSWRE